MKPAAAGQFHDTLATTNLEARLNSSFSRKHTPLASFCEGKLFHSKQSLLWLMRVYQRDCQGGVHERIAFQQAAAPHMRFQMLSPSWRLA
jgi:predicted transposase YdaD